MPHGINSSSVKWLCANKRLHILSACGNNKFGAKLDEGAIGATGIRRPWSSVKLRTQTVARRLVAVFELGAFAPIGSQRR